MRIVMTHYHLRAGGVTRVMEREVTALKELDPSLEIILLSGSIPDTRFAGFEGVTIDVVPELNYWSPIDNPEAGDRVQSCCDAALEKYRDDETLFHFHNHALGKNPALTLAVYKLVEKGARALLHCHDFAEDRLHLFQELKSYFRTQNLQPPLHTYLYPQSPSVHYAVINSADSSREFLAVSHPQLLNNPVVATYKSVQTREIVASLLHIDIEDIWVFYPVRCITRKNIGEILYLSFLMGGGIQWILSLPPENPLEIPQYETWVKLARELGLKVLFSAAQTVSFDNLMAQADMVVTTSLQEGFGMAYLEPLLLDKPIFGRRLSVIDDFEATGISFQQLYDKIPVKVEGETVDFGALDEVVKEDHLKLLVKSGSLRVETAALGTSLRTLFHNTPDVSYFEKQKKCIEEHYSPEKHGLELMSLYKKLFD